VGYCVSCFNIIEIDQHVMTFQNQMHVFLTHVKTEQLVIVFWSMNTTANVLLVIMVMTATLVSILSGIRKHIARNILWHKTFKTYKNVIKRKRSMGFDKR